MTTLLLIASCIRERIYEYDYRKMMTISSAPFYDTAPGVGDQLGRKVERAPGGTAGDRGISLNSKRIEQMGEWSNRLIQPV
ncbi:uncharacterized protein N7479_007681 [Penicillium vulpinum]|uniref:uncharacterized protein n=1 Tax=Penicillium vulpinum TaxID=29845 RepID=UPI0025484CDF|nr:uncharacterized protein N7479_007681 [Penicillium vulpinum]KAJ5960531.1 hypothetical protein N7479_007681 [Penicillium vulpinum]